MIPSQRIHIALPVSDLAASTAFYERLFGQAPSKTKTDYAKFEAHEPPVHLALNATSESISPQRDPYHFGIQLASPSAFEALRDRVSAAGLAGKREEEVTCCYAVSNKLWLVDPDGHRWELFHTLSDATVRQGDAPPVSGESSEAPRSCCAPTCCQP